MLKKGHKRRIKEFLETMAIYTPNLSKEDLNISRFAENKWQFSSDMLQNDIALIDRHSQQYGSHLKDKPEDVQIAIKTLYSLAHEEAYKNRKFADRILNRYGNI